MSFNHIDYVATSLGIDNKVLKSIQRLDDLRIEAARLKTLQPVRATPHYHKNSHGQPRYLYLIHPQKNGQRKREYIGCKPDRIAAALARVQAHRDLVEVLRQAADIRSRLDLVARYLAAALRAAEGGETGG